MPVAPGFWCSKQYNPSFPRKRESIARMQGAALARITIGLANSDAMERRVRRAFRGEKQGVFISFASPELLWKVITPKRWEVLRAMTGAGPLAIREVARRVQRDVKSVHGDSKP